MSDPVASLRRELVAAAQREAARNSARAPSRPSWRVARLGRPALVAFGLLALASGTALAGSQLFGSPVRAGLVLSGGPRPGQVALAGLRVPDPAGGLPWGARIYVPHLHGSNAAARFRCVQIGRVLGGRLGVIGEDGAFADDGLFHVLPASPELGCARAGSIVESQTYIPASAFTGAGACVAVPEVPAPGSGRRAARGRRSCRAADRRLVVFGIAPARTTLVSLSGPSGVATEHLAESDYGAFLFVLPVMGSVPGRAPLRVTFAH